MTQPVTHLVAQDLASCLKTIWDSDGNPDVLNSFFASVRRTSSHCLDNDDQTILFISVLGKTVYCARDKLELYDTEINNPKELNEVIIWNLQNKFSQAKQLHSEDIKSYSNRL